MGFEDTSLMKEIEKIFAKENEVFANHHWRTELRVIGQQDPIAVIKTLSIDIKRDYLGAYADEIVIECVMGGGTFAFDVYPNRTKLEITLVRDPIGLVDEAVDLSKDISNQVFSAFLIETGSEAVEANDLRKQSKAAGDLTELKTVKFQLLDRAVEQVRVMGCGGVFRDTTAADAIKFLLTKLSKDIDVEEADEITGVNMYPPHNTTPQKNIVLPHGLAFTDMPEYVVHNVAAIYNSGFGVYLQKHTWYVYPTHDLTRYDKSPKGLTLINVPPKRFPNVEKTFRRTPNQIIAMVTGEVKHLDMSDRKQLNEGNGIRFTDARNVLDGFAHVENNRAVVLRANNNNEYLTKERENGINNVRLGPRRITSNTFLELSRMAQRNGAYITVTWENSDPGIIEPGMPVNFMYVVKSRVFEAKGVVTQAHHHIGMTRPGFDVARHHCQSVLQLFVEGNLQWDEAEDEAA